jgi:dihydroneopterin aldolase
MTNYAITEQIMEVGPIDFEVYLGPYEYEKTIKQRVLVTLEIKLQDPETPRTKDNWFNWTPVRDKLMGEFSDQHFNVHGELSLAIANLVFEIGGVSEVVVTTIKPYLFYNVVNAGMRVTYKRKPS